MGARGGHGEWRAGFGGACVRSRRRAPREAAPTARAAPRGRRGAGREGHERAPKASRVPFFSKCDSTRCAAGAAAPPRKNVACAPKRPKEEERWQRSLGGRGAHVTDIQHIELDPKTTSYIAFS